MTVFAVRGAPTSSMAVISVAVKRALLRLDIGALDDLEHHRPPHRPFAAIVHGLHIEAVVLVQGRAHYVGKGTDAAGRSRNPTILGPGMEFRNVLYRNVLVDRRRQVTSA